MTPPSPWSGSSSTAATVSGPRPRRAPPRRRRARGRSPRAAAGTAACFSGWPVAVSVASVRPWNELSALMTTWRPRAGPAPGQLQGALVGLGPRVGEEDLPAGLAGAAVDQAVDGQRHLGPQRVAVEVGHVAQRAGLGGHGVGHLGVGMAERHHGQAGDEVEVAPCRRRRRGRVPVAPHEGDRRLGVGAHERAAIRHAPCDGGFRAHGSTMVPTPESVKSSSSSACGTRPSRMWARATPPRTAWAHASILGIMPPTAPPPRRISSTTSRLA